MTMITTLRRSRMMGLDQGQAMTTVIMKMLPGIWKNRRRSKMMRRAHLKVGASSFVFLFSRVQSKFYQIKEVKMV